LRKIFYKIFVNNRVIDFIGSPFVSIAIPPIVALYYGTLDIWGDDWSIVKNYKPIHEVLFSILAGLTVIVLFIKGMAEQFRGSVATRYQNILQAMVAYFNELVKKKRDRFFQKAKSLKPNADVFKNITHPKDQIEYALDGTKRLLNSAFTIDPKNTAITIIQGSPENDRWWYEFKCDTQKQHTKAKVIMTGDSTARYCYETGESIFIPDIRKGIKEGAFLPSDRSKKSQIGSIYCKPVRVAVNNLDYTYIFTIVVYGQFMCTPYDEEECRACERLLDEVSDRVELELYLHSMKSYIVSGGKAA
jgi:hypothetical protein